MPKRKCRRILTLKIKVSEILTHQSVSVGNLSAVNKSVGDLKWVNKSVGSHKRVNKRVGEIDRFRHLHFGQKMSIKG